MSVDQGVREEEQEKLRQMCPEEIDPVEAWAELEKVLRAELAKEQAVEEERVWEGATPREVAARVAGFLDKKAVAKAVSLVGAFQVEGNGAGGG